MPEREAPAPARQAGGLCLAMCVQDEAAALRDHLRYHRALGVSRAYVFMDRCRDGTAELLRGMPWVRAFVADRDRSSRHLSLHQNACCLRALAMARQEGYRWLLHIDPDEFAWGGDGSGSSLLGDASLTAMLASLPAQVGQVRLATLEVVPVRGEPADPPWRQAHFQPPGRVWRRTILDPADGQLRELGKWMGHAMGKSIVRTDLDVEPLNPHGWKLRGAQARDDGLSTLTRGHHYHFLFGDAASWLAKYRKLADDPSLWPNGTPVPFPKQSWKQAASRFKLDEAIAYHQRWIAVDPADVHEALGRGQVVRDPRVARLMAWLDQASDDGRSRREPAPCPPGSEGQASPRSCVPAASV